MLTPIHNTPRDYAWGGVDAISELLGLEPTGGPQAELWLGTHPGCPARVVATGQPLTEVAEDLPFLLKVLAAAEPLSLQVHPDAVQARVGFAREEAAGIDRNAPARVYRDPEAKAELILALSDTFEAQVGFRAVVETESRLMPLIGAAGAHGLAQGLHERLRDDAGVGRGFLWLLSDAPAARGLVAALAAEIPGLAAEYPVQARLAALHPGDPGVVASLLLNHVTLRRGEALWIPPGTIHGYLHGIGIELLSPSDNVVRGGLTPKHVDLIELERLLDVRASAPMRLEPSPAPGGGRQYAPPAPAPFRLLAVGDLAEVQLEGPAIALCIEGEFEVTGRSGAVQVRGGEAVYASPDEALLRAEGRGELCIAV